MKKIFVSVEELLENGGELIIRQELFDEQGNRMGEYKGIDSDNMYLVGLFSQTYYPHQIYVQIDCTPHYV